MNTPARPANIWSALRVALVCATVTFLAWQYLRPAPHPPRRLWTPVVVTPEGQENVLQAGTRRLEFWTPSARTKEYLAGEGGAIRERDKWEAIPGDETVNRFGTLLRTNAGVLGYRRAEVWGHGRTVLKPGWWWTMTVTTNYTLQNLTRSYRDYWKSTNTLFIEAIDNPGQE